MAGRNQPIRFLLPTSIIMASRKRLRLTDLVIKRAKHTGSGRTTVLPDGDGLRLLIYANGNKVWQFRAKRAGKETTIQLGAYSELSLAEAREEAEKIRKLMRDGRNPVVERRVQKAREQISAENTFQAVAKELFEVKKKNVSQNYYDKIRGAVEANLFPSIGRLPIQSIDAPLLREALTPIEARGSLDMLGFVRRIAGEIFDLAKATARFTGDNPAHVLRKNIFAEHQGENMEALAWEDMPGFLHRLDGMRGEFATIAALRLTILTATRPGEVRRAKWDEFDLKSALWTIPSSRMKRRKKHVVPLARQTVKLLKELYALTGHGEYLFPSQRGSKSETLSDMTLLKAARRHSINQGITVHGFRATFRTHAEESELWSYEVMEAALSHKIKDEEVAAYARATHLRTRTKLAQWYADELDKAKGVAS